jgi:hypothetical protein
MSKTFAGLIITLDAIHCDNYEISFVSYIYLMQAILIFTCWFIYRHTANYSDYTVKSNTPQINSYKWVDHNV